jgi:hypothetical protein
MFLLQTPYLYIARVPGFDVIHFKRLPETSNDPDVIHTTMTSIVAAMDSLDRARFGLLVDVREAPFRSDPEFERILAVYRPRFLSGFANVAILARTQVGKLQVARMAREDGVGVRIFDDESEAMSYLVGDVFKVRERVQTSHTK